MTNHPNRKPTPYHVTAYPGELLGKFAHEASALRVAQMWSARWKSWAEVRRVGKIESGAGLIGQFEMGEPTPEFECVRSVVFPQA